MAKKKRKGLEAWTPKKNTVVFFGVDRNLASYRVSKRAPDPRDELIELMVTESEWKEFKKWQKLTLNRS